MNPNIKNLSVEVLSDNWYVLKKATFDYLGRNKQWQTQQREAYDRGNGATILLYNTTQNTVVLTRQFRLPTYINGNETGLLIESCAGLLDADTPEDCIRRECEEETGYVVRNVRKIFQVYMSPGSVTEIVHFFIAEYEEDDKLHEGGGVAHEHENIEVLEFNFDDAYAMIASGEICDGKTILLLQHLKLSGFPAKTI